MVEDGLQFPDDAELRLKSPDDDWSDLVIPDDSFLQPHRLPAKRSARSQSVQGSASMSLSRSSSIASTHGSLSRSSGSRIPAELAKMTASALRKPVVRVEEESTLGFEVPTKVKHKKKKSSQKKLFIYLFCC